MSRRAFDVVVVGGGIVGLAIANAWLDIHIGDSVAVLDKEVALALHASGRNSGVLHAGFYYAPDSLKARLTRDGNRLLREFCEASGVAVRQCGKVVVAQGEADLLPLQELMRRGRANGVDVELIDEHALAELEPLARTHSQALWSPSTAVADPVAVVEALARHFEHRGGTLLLGHTVLGATGGTVWTDKSGAIEAGHIVNAAGLYADRVAHWFDVGSEYRMLPFKGLYWYGSWPVGRLQRHVYPVPDPRNPFLGVHMTVTAAGQAKLGPTAIPSLWREDYGGFQGFQASELAEILKTYPRFAASKHHDVPALLRSELPKYVRSHMVAQAKKLVPSVNARDFKLRGRPGVRAQLFDMARGRLEMDFVVRSGDRSTHVLNAVSPAWTSSLAVGKHVVEGISTTGF